MNNDQLLTQLEQEVEKHLQLVIHDFQNTFPERLQKQPVAGGWSVVQCIWHLNSYSAYYLPLIEQALNQPHQAQSTFRGSFIGSLFTRMMQPGKGKYKAFKDHVPPDFPDVVTTLSEYIGYQEQLLLLLRKAKQADLDRIKIPISIMRWVKLKLGDVFQFIITHEERHLQQAVRVVNGH